MMLYTQSIDEVHLEKSWVTIGTFDGVHRGHQVILRTLVEGARALNLPSVVITFHPHPRQVVNGRTGSFYLTLPSERAALLSELGVDVVIMLPFNAALASTSAEQFIQSLVTRLGMVQLWVGHDFALGKGREGNVTRLHALGLELGYQVVEVDPMTHQAEAVSSSRIRAVLSSGDVRQACAMLGRPYQVSGEVVPGDQRGRRVGIPTANLAVPEGKLLPAPGVYACRLELNGKRYASAVNIGVRPTFSGLGDTIHVEAHLLDFSGDLYGNVLTLEFLERLRSEKRFESVDALITQVRSDIQRTREIVSL